MAVKIIIILILIVLIFIVTATVFTLLDLKKLNDYWKDYDETWHKK